MSGLLKDRWALVTGAAGAIGGMIVRGLMEHGCNVVAHARSPAQAGALRELGARVTPAFADLSKPDEVDRMLEEAQRVSGGIDVLYANAAIVTPRRGPADTPLEDFRVCFEVNTLAPIRATYALLPRMLERRFGRVVHVTSGIQDQPELAAYAISKAALDKFVRDMAIALRGTGVLMNLIDPGWVKTRLGGPNAPCPLESVLPGMLVPALVEGEVHGVFFRAQDYARLA